MRAHLIILCATALMAANWTRAEEVGELEPIVIGKPERIEVFPSSFSLTSQRQVMHLVVTGHYAGGLIQDLTRAASYTSSDEKIVAASQVGVAAPRADGKAQIVISVADQSLTVPVQVSGQGQPDPVSFYYGTMPALSKHGCSSGACHGSPSGKGGFQLSLRAFDPGLDKFTLIREDFGRRTNPIQPAESLILIKPTMKVSHGGGQRLKKHDEAYQLLHDWISAGCPIDPDDRPICERIEVYPPSGRVLKRPAHTQQLCVLAYFSDGSVRDITSLAVFSSSDENVANVTPAGLVIGRDRGQSAIIVRYLEFLETTYLTFVKDIEGFAWNDPPVNNYIDELVHDKLRQLKYIPSQLCSDEEFVRRVYLDVIGLLPTVDEAKVFLSDLTPGKRQKLIGELLRRPEFAKFWALKWSDLLRLTSKKIGTGGVHKYYRWLERAMAQNMPYDEFVRQLLTSTGSTLGNPPANYFRTASDVNDALETTAQLFLGSRIQCAKCHNHPYERWTQDNYYGLAAVFNRVQRKKTGRGDEMVIWVARSGEVTQPRTGKQMKPWAPGVGQLEIPRDQDRRLVFAQWMTDTRNPYFAKVEVNRIWNHLLGRGIVDPPGDFRDSNPPSNAELLDALAEDFVRHRFDRKHILRTILCSRTYQASARSNNLNKDDTKYFSHYRIRMLSAEQLLDAISQISAVPERFASVPPDTKATQLPSPDMAKSEFMKIFGQPERQTACECERSNNSSLGQALQLLNGQLIHKKLCDKNNRLHKMIAAKAADADILSELYLAAFSRLPSDEELQASLKHIQERDNRAEALEDVGWAIINTNEFMFQH